MTTTAADHWVRACATDDLKTRGCIVSALAGHTVAVLWHDGEPYAIDNRCPHMGFPLHKCGVKDKILTCHWHHARFDVSTGGTFDPWADDIPTFPVELRNGEVWVDMTPPAGDQTEHHKTRLREGLEQNISLVTAKSVIALTDADVDPVESLKIGLDFGIRYQPEWRGGLTTLTCFVNLLPAASKEHRAKALYQGLADLGTETIGQRPNFLPRPLPGNPPEIGTLKRWLRQFVEVRDPEGCERAIVSAVESGASSAEVADMLYAAVTDYRYVTTGHVMDFANKACEALEYTGWQDAGTVLASLATPLAFSLRGEENNAWRHPIDLVELLDAAFEKLPDALEQGRAAREQGDAPNTDTLVDLMLGDDPAAIIDAMVAVLCEGALPDSLASTVSYAAARRVIHFPISNELSDWDTALHSFTFANAVQQAQRRAPSAEILRGVFDGAMTVYLNRFLNIPSRPIPTPEPAADTGDGWHTGFLDLLNSQQQVDEAGRRVAAYLAAGGDVPRLHATLIEALLREDRDFHTIQMTEAALRQYADRAGTPEGNHILIAAARYLAAHAPTLRRQNQTYTLAWKLQRGVKIYED